MGPDHRALQVGLASGRCRWSPEQERFRLVTRVRAFDMSTSTASSTDTSRKSQALNRQIVFWAITSALAGFLFGFDTVVISGAEQKIQALWGLSSGVHGFAIASALYGTVLGSLFGAGQRIISVARRRWCASARSTSLGGGQRVCQRHAMFIVARVIGGIGIGISTVAAPLYISEIARQPIADGSRARSSSISCLAFSSRLPRTRCSPASVKMPGVGCWVSRRFPPLLTRSCVSGFRKARAG